MEKITPKILSDTLNIIQLARESAREQGKKVQEDLLEPVVDQLIKVVNNENSAKVQNSTVGLLAQEDFRTMMEAANNNRMELMQNISPIERNQIVTSMASGGMPDVDIARQLGLTREEVRLIIHISQAGRSVTNA